MFPSSSKKRFLKTVGIRLFNFTLISCSVKWILTIPVWPNRTFLRLLCSVDHTAGCLFPGRVSSVSEICIPSTIFPLGWSPIPVKSASGQVSHWSTFPLGLSPVPVKSPSGQVTQRSFSHLACHLFQSSLTVVRWCHKLSENPFMAPSSGTCSMLLVWSRQSILLRTVYVYYFN